MTQISITSATTSGTGASLVAAAFGTAIFPITLKVTNRGLFDRNLGDEIFAPSQVINVTFNSEAALAAMVEEAIEASILNGDAAGMLFETVFLCWNDDGVKPWELAFTGSSVAFGVATAFGNSKVHAGFGEIGTLLHIGPLAAREHDPEPGPVHAVDDADAFGVAIGNEDAKSEGISGHFGYSALRKICSSMDGSSAFRDFRVSACFAFVSVLR
jgi:hypothetical protein